MSRSRGGQSPGAAAVRESSVEELTWVLKARSGSSERADRDCLGPGFRETWGERSASKVRCSGTGWGDTEEEPTRPPGAPGQGQVSVRVYK